jgi:hypothetical protein
MVEACSQVITLVLNTIIEQENPHLLCLALFKDVFSTAYVYSNAACGDMEKQYVVLIQ